MKNLQTIRLIVTIAFLTGCASSNHSDSHQVWFRQGVDRNKVLEIVRAVFKSHGYELHPAPAETKMHIRNGNAEVTTEVDPYELQTNYQNPVQELGPSKWRYSVKVGGDSANFGSEVIVDVELHAAGEIMGFKTETAVSLSNAPDTKIIIKEIRDKIKALGWYDNRFD